MGISLYQKLDAASSEAFRMEQENHVYRKRIVELENAIKQVMQFEDEIELKYTSGRIIERWNECKRILNKKLEIPIDSPLTEQEKKDIEITVNEIIKNWK